MVDNYTRLNWLDPKFGESVLSGASQAFAAWTQTVWDPAVFSAWNLSFSKDRWEVESLEEKWQHVYASGLETAQAVTLFFNMFFLFDVSCHWGGMGGDVYIRCTCTHAWCYVSTSSSGDVNVLWMCAHPQSTGLEWFLTHFCARALARVWRTDAHVSLVMSLVLILHTCLMLRKCIVFRRCQHILWIFAHAQT